ncbi:MAG: hypothetical protein COW75_08375 [Rhodobacterales bacterium CG18_big_fil_WC_8_21_14_2_50_71_9]|nr:MAG: hypothetical protein COW75_08375 [Rhodobacterales bacterium CG18_big_fil_WC_8_21_14_2_50_71_9]
MKHELAQEKADMIGRLSPDARLSWARDVLRQRAALSAGLAISGPWMVRRAEAIIARAATE